MIAGLWFEEDSWRLQIHNDCRYQQQVYSKQSNTKQKEQYVRKFLYKNYWIRHGFEVECDSL